MRRRRSLATFVAAAIGTLAVSSAALAQTGRRMTMVSDDGVQRSVATFSVPVRSLVVEPDMRLEDLPELARLLALSEPQQDLIAELLRAYVAEVEGLPLELPPDGTPLGGEPAPEAEDPDGPPRGPFGDLDAGRLLRDAMREADLDPTRLDEGGDLDVSIGISISTGASPDGGPPEPSVNVSLSIGPAEGVSLSQEEMDALRAIAEQVAPVLEEGAREQAIQQAEDQAAFGDPQAEQDARMLAMLEDAERRRRAVSDYELLRRRVLAKFDTAAKGYLAEDQLAAWPRVESWRRRARTLEWGQLSGESVDVVGIAERLLAERSDLPDDTIILLQDGERRIDQLLEQRNDLLRELDARIDEAAAEGDGEEIVRLAERESRLRVAVRDANLGLATTLSGLLGETAPTPEPASAGLDPAAGPASLGEQLAAQVRAAAFPRVAVSTPAGRAFDAVRDLEVAPEIRSAIGEMEHVWKQAHDVASERIQQIILRDEPERERGSMFSLASDLGASNADRIERPEENTIIEAMERRLALDKRTMQALYALFPDEVVARLPRLPEVRDLGPIRVESGDGEGLLEGGDID